MSEIYRDSVNKAVTLNIPSAQVTDVKFVKNGAVVANSTASPALIPYAITRMDGIFYTNWTYIVEGQTYVRSDINEVVTPLFTAEELVEFNSTFLSLSDNKVAELERLVRGIIQGYCNQKFGLESGELNLRGHGNSVLMSPRRIISIDGIGSGDFLLPYAYRPVKAGYAIERDMSYIDDGFFSSTGPIVAPYAFSDGGLFRTGLTYTIHGTFGWEAVPTDVKQAALILAEQFSCKEASWRDRYLRVVSAADWRFEFDGAAFAGTGSVSVDQLLNQYVVGGMAVI